MSDRCSGCERKDDHCHCSSFYRIDEVREPLNTVSRFSPEAEECIVCHAFFICDCAEEKHKKIKEQSCFVRNHYPRQRFFGHICSSRCDSKYNLDFHSRLADLSTPKYFRFNSDNEGSV